MSNFIVLKHDITKRTYTICVLLQSGCSLIHTSEKVWYSYKQGEENNSKKNAFLCADRPYYFFKWMPLFLIDDSNRAGNFSYRRVFQKKMGPLRLYMVHLYLSWIIIKRCILSIPHAIGKFLDIELPTRCGIWNEGSALFWAL